MRSFHHNGPAITLFWVCLFAVAFSWVESSVAVVRIAANRPFRPEFPSWISALCATPIILYTFIADLPATLQGSMPQPYNYWLLATGLVLYATSCYFACPASQEGREQ